MQFSDCQIEAPTKSVRLAMGALMIKERLIWLINTAVPLVLNFAELGGTVILEDNYQTGDKDFSAQITKLKGQKAKADLLYIASGPDDVGTIVKQFRDAGIKTPIMGGDGYDTPLLVQVAGAGAENVYFTTHSLMDANLGTAAVKKFISGYQAEYKSPPENAFAGLGYDTVKLLADAIKRAGSTDPKAIRTALQATSGLAGVTVILVENGTFTLAQEVVPQKIPAP